jgi:large subunit ribosomal protein L10
LPTAKKIEDVQELTDKVSRSTIAIGTDYRGLTVRQITDLRRALRGAEVELRVVKNILEGPTAVACGYGDDVVAPARALSEFLRSSRLDVKIYGAYVEGQVIDRKGVEDLASVPPREILLGKIAGALISPAAELAGLLSGTLREFAGLVEARADQMESGGTAAA